ncbi:MAG: hypothetical protein ACLQVF_20730 [Isosphaeraceae bacterium]
MDHNHSQSHTQLRADNPHYPSFVMVDPPPEPEHRKGRVAEWVMAVWMNQVDPNVLGVRRVVDEKNGEALVLVHIAIPLEYQRKQLARTLALAQIEDGQSTPRVNLISSAGFDHPHSFIRVPAEAIVSLVMESFQDDVLNHVVEINDHTIGVPQAEVEAFLRAARPRPKEEDAQLKAALHRALKMKNTPLEHDQIQLLFNKNTHERFVKIKNVARNERPALKQVIKEAGVKMIAQDEVDDAHWSILFTASEAKKLLSE